MQPHYDDDAMARATKDTEFLHDMHALRQQASSDQPTLTYQQSFELFKQKNEKYTEASLKAYKEWWRARMREIGAENKATFIEFMTTGNGLCRTHPLKCIDGFPKFEHYDEFLGLLDANGEWGKALRGYLMTRAMPAMVAKVYAEGKGGFKSKSKSKSMRRRRNGRKRKSKTNKRRRHH